MKKKLSILLVISLMIFAFLPALTLAQDDLEDNQETVIEENEENLDENEEEQDTEETEEETEEKTYDNLEELLADLEANEDLNSIEKVNLKRKLTTYDESLNIETMTSVVDKILNEEIDLGQGFVILKNLDESVKNGVNEDRALKLINNYQNQDDSGQFAFQTALELRKLSREDLSGEKSEAFADEINSIIEEKGEIETSELKQLAAEYRKEAREENRKRAREKNREQIQGNKSQNADSASEKALNKGNNSAEKGLNKEDKGKNNSSNAADNSKDKGTNKSKGKGTNNSSNSQKNNNGKK